MVVCRVADDGVHTHVEHVLDDLAGGVYGDEGDAQVDEAFADDAADAADAADDVVVLQFHGFSLGCLAGVALAVGDCGDELGEGVGDDGDAGDEEECGELFAGGGDVVVAVADGGDGDECEEEGFPERPSLDPHEAVGADEDDEDDGGACEEDFSGDRVLEVVRWHTRGMHRPDTGWSLRGGGYLVCARRRSIAGIA